MANDNAKTSESTNLSIDDKIQQTAGNFSTSLDTIEHDLEKALKLRENLNLSTDEKIQLDTYLAYLNSTLYWMLLKLQGVDVTKHAIVNDLSRAKDLMSRNKAIDESLKAPRLDMPATKRFIQAGMHTRFIEMNGIMVTEEQYESAKSAPKAPADSSS